MGEFSNSRYGDCRDYSANIMSRNRNFLSKTIVKNNTKLVLKTRKNTNTNQGQKNDNNKNKLIEEC